jgi:integrase
LGHSTFTLTLDTYGDYILEQDGGAANDLPEPPRTGKTNRNRRDVFSHSDRSS